MFFGGGTREGRKVVPITTETVFFCSGLMNPSVFVFVLFVFFPELDEEELKRGVCFFFVFCFFVAKVEGQEELRTMTEKNNISP